MAGMAHSSTIAIAVSAASLSVFARVFRWLVTTFRYPLGPPITPRRDPYHPQG